MRRNTVGISRAELGNDDREPSPHFLLVASGDDPARMILVGKLRHQIEERTAAIGMAAAGFQNLLFVDGPQSPNAFANGPTCAELQGDWIVRLLDHVRQRDWARFEGTAPQRKPGGRRGSRWRAVHSSRKPTPGLSPQTFPENRVRCCPSPAVCRPTWRNATKAPNEGTRDSRSAELRLWSSP